MARPDDERFEERPRGEGSRGEGPRGAESRGERRPRRREEFDDDEVDERPRRRRQKGGSLSGVIPYRNVMALTAYYCAFGSLIAILGTLTLVKAMGAIPAWVVVLGLGMGGMLAPVAAVLGILGLNYVAKYPEAKGTAHAIVGIILGGLEIVALLIIVFAKVVVIGSP